ncbi:antibiotic biosynthesis monooxygenase [Arthrobacter echini]|uniref:Antibiotic biosynthesis monooxygenase n=1 Tax=Arthrobacter echini TaxID=1529066 RepID=A0A5D0XVR3_9MICC|nr:antibiotic biosynthesis monooxygenase [Arthrobacter echini]TYD00082.1 antibiotic biosynthesis monooxygenase [Arthrobacter echini]
MSEPVDVTAIFTPQEGEFTRVKLALDLAIEQVVQEPGCLRYEITEAQEDRIVLQERWESTEALDLHMRGPALQDLGESLSALLAAQPHVVRSDQQA